MFKLHSSGIPLFSSAIDSHKVANVTFNLARTIVISTLLCVLAACQTYRFEDAWPPQMPPRQLFIDGYLEKRALKTATNKELAYHLGWIKKFYQGTTLYPVGWLSASQRYIDSIESEEDKRVAASRLTLLGVTISNEWAQDNPIRLINNSNIATWASAMRTAADRREQQEFLDKVEQDVEALLAGQIRARDIKYERYFAEESYDDF